jgi:peptidoglycan/LPS O-acetylase OafA/YrhL
MLATLQAGQALRARPSALVDHGFHIASLDGMRALAALIVFVGHAGLGDMIPGGFGVTVFFFLSGYLITTLLRREFEQTGGINLRNFYLRRIYRIFPPLYLVLTLLVVLALTGVTRNPMQPGAVLAQFAHLTNYYLIAWGSVDTAPVVPFTVPMWSLAVEEHFYLLFPLTLLLLLGRLSRQKAAAALGIACGIFLAWRCVLIFWLDAGGLYTYHATDTRIDSLLYGCIMGLWWNPAMDKAPQRMPGVAWAVVCVAALALLLFTFAYRSEAFRDTLRYSLQGIALFPIFYCAVRYHGLPVFAWLDSRPMRALGLISYTFYLSHEACIVLTGRWLGDTGIARAAAGFALTVAFSTACYLLIEQRMAVLRRRLHG